MMFDILKKRFYENTTRHPDLDWETVEARLRGNADAAGILERMEESGGEPDTIGFDRETGKVNTYTDSSNTGVFQFTLNGSSVTKNVNMASDINTIVIKVQTGNNIYEITLYGATGKVKMEKK